MCLKIIPAKCGAHFAESLFSTNSRAASPRQILF
ncbi:MAG: DUF6783 domain-containing protein [Blautia faecis]